MGQYYCGVILGNSLSKKKIVIKKSFYPYHYDNGAKLMEHSYVNNYYVKAFEFELANDFYQSHFVWVGDYADEKFDTDVFSKAYDWIEKNRTNLKKNQNKYEDLVNEYYNYKYIINFTKKEFIRIPVKKDKNLVIHPLPLLCSNGNGRGSGDYCGKNMELIGSWAYDKIGVGNEIPQGITKELVATFIEEYDDEGCSKINDYKYVEHTE